MGFTYDGASDSFVLNSLLRAVEPPTAALLDLPKLAAAAATYFPSRNRQTHLYAINERANAHSIALKRLFLRWCNQLRSLIFLHALAMAPHLHMADAP